MKQIKSLQRYFGLKQEEMALFLNVNRAQWSMYVLGKRKLPLAAMHKLTELLTYIEQNQSFKSRESVLLSKNYCELKIIKNEQKKRALEQKRIICQKKINEIDRAYICLQFMKLDKSNSVALLTSIENRLKKQNLIYNTINLEQIIEKCNQIELEITFLRKELLRTV